MLGVPEKDELPLLKKQIPKQYSIGTIEAAFLESVDENTAGVTQCAVLFSGGLDSSLIAFAVAKKVRKTVLYCCGIAGSKALTRAAKAADLLGLNLKKVVVDHNAIEQAVRNVIEIIGTRNLMHVQIAVPEYLCLRAIKKDSLNIVFTGQGADELFAGYDEFRRVISQKGISGAESVLWRRIINLYEDNINRDSAIAEHLGLELRAPFMHREFMLQALAVPVEKNILDGNDFMRKHMLRELAKQLGLPEKLCYEKKKAIQYDSGIAKYIRKALLT